MLQVQGEALHAAVASGKEGGQVGGQPAQREQQCLMRLDLEVQLDAFIEPVRRHIAVQGQRTLAEQGIQMLLHLCREAPRQGVAR
ncbi:hypothetical protein D3C86_1687630 [compost metagenome]